MNSRTCSIFFHNYYGRHEDWIRLLCERINFPFTLFYNIVEDSIHNSGISPSFFTTLQNKLPASFLQKLIIRKSSNQGKDIGGKLVLLDTWLHGNAQPGENDCMIFLHDKMSPHKTDGLEWRKKLFRIVDPEFIEKALSVFDAGKMIGVLSCSQNIKNEIDPGTAAFSSKNRKELTRLQSAFGWNLKDYRYVAGTMFWARALPVFNFINQYAPLDIRATLEKGNVMDESAGTVTHAWERLICWMVTAQGFTLNGISC